MVDLIELLLTTGLPVAILASLVRDQTTTAAEAAGEAFAELTEQVGRLDSRGAPVVGATSSLADEIRRAKELLSRIDQNTDDTADATVIMLAHLIHQAEESAEAAARARLRQNVAIGVAMLSILVALAIALG